eukprot:TRINITY_DN839_c0_g1_i1.p1 TRINITY_DN839_c0_g1~~TRINITY_DN839_c0_g1_i1.p1  ORF type:complete len:401 (+),score=116.53 TRINITY_DN839_c0_g1_i1:35-1237(+)
MASEQQIIKSEYDEQEIKNENQSSSDQENEEMAIDEEDQDKEMHDKVKKFDPLLIQRDLEKLLVDVMIVHLDKKGNECKELILKQSIEDLINDNKDIQLSKLVTILKEMGFPMDNCMIYYYSPDAEMYVYCGIDPVQTDIFIPNIEFFEKQQLRIKYKECAISLIHQIMGESVIDNNEKQNDNGQEKRDGQNNNCRRTKERKIGFIIEKVAEWRQLYNGVQDQTGKPEKRSLEDAAQQVKISKKSLDDYLLQIKFGKKFGFNFNEHKNDKVGVLRAFVKKNKAGQQEKSKQRKTTTQPKKKQKGGKKLKYVGTHIQSIITVSYTHLRAHETRHDLVCRLLLEKKKKKRKKKEKNEKKERKQGSETRKKKQEKSSVDKQKKKKRKNKKEEKKKQKEKKKRR